MSYDTLAKKLKGLAVKLEKHAADLGGTELTKAVVTFEGQLNKFEPKIDDAIAGLGPGMRELKGLLDGPDKKLLTEAGLKVSFKQVLGIKAPDKKGAGLRKELLKKTGELNRGQKVLEQLREIINKARAPKVPIQKDAEKLRLEINRLGGLDDEQLAYELESRYARLADLKNLAKANGIIFDGKTPKGQLLKAVIERARRIHGHRIG